MATLSKITIRSISYEKKLLLNESLQIIGSISEMLIRSLYIEDGVGKVYPGNKFETLTAAARALRELAEWEEIREDERGKPA